MSKIFSNIELPLPENLIIEDWKRVELKGNLGADDDTYEITKGGFVRRFVATGVYEKQLAFVPDIKTGVSWLTETKKFVETSRTYVSTVVDGNFVLHLELLAENVETDGDDWNIELKMSVRSNEIQSLILNSYTKTPAKKRLLIQAEAAEQDIKKRTVWFRVLWAYIKFHFSMTKYRFSRWFVQK